jgi:ATP-dependent RNA helicase RhlE
MSRALVFTRTKRGADRVARQLEAAGIRVAAIHGNKSQSQREHALAAFRASKVRALVATDIAARGIDIDEVTHVVNYELPDVPESYVHRIGRTARAGAIGFAISLCAADERAQLRNIEHLIRQSIPAEDRRKNRGGPAGDPPRGFRQPATETRADAPRTGRQARRGHHRGFGSERRSWPTNGVLARRGSERGQQGMEMVHGTSQIPRRPAR